MPLQVWAGPLAGGDVVALLLNIGPRTATITASWHDIGLQRRAMMTATDLWTGQTANESVADSIEATVASHDCAVFRLSPT